MSVKKTYPKTKPNTCKVTLKLAKKMVGDAQKVAVCGDFTDWEPTVEMKKNKDGSFSTSVELEAGREYQFRYFIDGERWENDDDADRYVSCGAFPDVENSVIAA